MLEEIKRLFAELHGGAKHSSHFNGDDYRVAAAAAARPRGDARSRSVRPAARQKLHNLLMAQFSLTDALTDELIEWPRWLPIGRRSTFFISPA